jgi:vanillate/3-O-methylgallate O-demethylase
MYNKGNMYYDTGACYAWLPGLIPEYTGWKDEQISWKTDCYIGDWTLALNELRVSGPDAFKFFSDIATNSFQKFSIGQAKHLVQCAENGKVTSEGILFRLSEDEFMLQSNVWWAYYLFEKNKEKYNATVKMATMKDHGGFPIEADWFKIQVSGPKSIYLVEKIVNQSLREVKFMHFVPIKINGHDLIALRQGMAGEIGFEIQGPLDLFEEIWKALFEAGEQFNCRRLGSRTSMINHLEACFPTGTVHYLGPEIQDYINFQEEKGAFVYYPTVVGSFDGDSEDLTYSPYEMGWGACVKFDHDFVGRKVLEKEAQDIKRKVVTLEFNSEDMIDIYASQFKTDKEPYELLEMPMTPNCLVQADKVLNEKGELIGISNTPGYSYFFRKILSLTFIDVKYSELGTEVTVLWGTPSTRQKKVRAVVAPAPYKTDNRRVDLKKV